VHRGSAEEGYEWLDKEYTVREIRDYGM
jgi:hypothetical protein